jgi:hypothetical protein
MGEISVPCLVLLTTLKIKNFFKEHAFCMRELYLTTYFGNKYISNTTSGQASGWHRGDGCS